jgi:hypothetical protein
MDTEAALSVIRNKSSIGPIVTEAWQSAIDAGAIWTDEHGHQAVRMIKCGLCRPPSMPFLELMRWFAEFS